MGLQTCMQLSAWMHSIHCVKNVQVQSYFWSVCSCIRTEYGPEITPYFNTFQAVISLYSCVLDTFS